jgi:hypothetical protein
MGAPPRGGLGQAEDAVSRNERSEELGISVSCHNVDGVDRERVLMSLLGRSLCWSECGADRSTFLRFRPYVL